ncbi:MAG: hypothetical protein EOP48_10315 [Sphingobacteriales bacterium]|nr:MAG: hypothetical protein EOP48_10315 [Sphingobacteriales bacterium]
MDLKLLKPTHLILLCTILCIIGAESFAQTTVDVKYDPTKGTTETKIKKDYKPDMGGGNKPASSSSGASSPAAGAVVKEIFDSRAKQAAFQAEYMRSYKESLAESAKQTEAAKPYQADLLKLYYWLKKDGIAMTYANGEKVRSYAKGQGIPASANEVIFPKSYLPINKDKVFSILTEIDFKVRDQQEAAATKAKADAKIAAASVKEAYEVVVNRNLPALYKLIPLVYQQKDTYFNSKHVAAIRALARQVDIPEADVQLLFYTSTATDPISYNFGEGLGKYTRVQDEIAIKGILVRHQSKFAALNSLMNTQRLSKGYLKSKETALAFTKVGIPEKEVDTLTRYIENYKTGANIIQWITSAIVSEATKQYSTEQRLDLLAKEMILLHVDNKKYYAAMIKDVLIDLGFDDAHLFTVSASDNTDEAFTFLMPYYHKYLALETERIKGLQLKYNRELKTLAKSMTRNKVVNSLSNWRKIYKICNEEGFKELAEEFNVYRNKWIHRHLDIENERPFLILSQLDGRN